MPEEKKITRKEYLEGKVTHDEYYMRLAELIGINSLRSVVRGIADVATLKGWLEADPHMNTSGLRTWDARQESVRGIISRCGNIPAINETMWGDNATKSGAAWSLSDNICLLKAVARHIVEEAEQGKEETK